MALITRQLPALFNGVSQQPATLRLPSQGESSVNAYPTVVDGLRKRPGSQHLAKVSSADLSSAFIHTINRDAAERYVVVVKNGDIDVYDALTGATKTVVLTGSAAAYLASTDPAAQFALVSIADYTFVVNKSVTVATKGQPTTAPVDLPDWFVPDNWAYRPNTMFYTASINLDKGQVQTFSDLPTADDDVPPSEGDYYKVAGYDQDSFGAYYVVRRGGVWEETFKVGENVSLDEATMPHALVRKSDGSFEVQPFAWSARKFGDNESNPVPTFVGRKIKDVFYYKNRLGFVSDENVVFSGAGDYGNFFRNTVTDILDSDVVDAAVSNTKVSVLNYAVPFNSGLMLFSDQTQFSLNVDQILTPTSVSIDAVTEYEVNTRARPVGIGTDVYFVTESGKYSRLREYFVQEDNNSNTASDITAHVPRYVPSGVFRLAGNSNEDVLFAISDRAGEENSIYCYKFFWSGQDKLQSAWQHWEMGSDDVLLSIDVLENQLFALIKRTDGTHLEKFDVQSGVTAGNLTFDILLDRRVALTQGAEITYVGSDTLIQLPYDVAVADRPDFRVVRAGGAAPGSLVDSSKFTWDNAYTLRVNGELLAYDCYVGLNYEMRYRFSEQFFMNGEQAITTGRMQLRTFVLYFTETAFFKTSVDPYGVNDAQVESIVTDHLTDFTGKVLGEAALLTDTPVFTSGRYAFQVYGDAKQAIVELVNDTPYQTKFQSAEVEALYHNRARTL